MSNSPFAAYANSTLKFQVAGGSLEQDAQGNWRPAKAVIEVTALLDQAKPPYGETRPGVDTDAVYLEGWAVEPMELPSVITPDSLCEATWAGRKGRFFWELKGRSPWGYESSTGDEMRGYFKPSSFVVEGETWTPSPSPSPSPTPGDSGLIRVPFAFGDATPKSIATIEANQTVFTAQIIIQTPFNGVGAALSLGDVGVNNRLIRADQVNPALVAEYETNPAHTYTSDTQLLLTIVPGSGATQGSGYVLLEV